MPVRPAPEPPSGVAGGGPTGPAAHGSSSGNAYGWNESSSGLPEKLGAAVWNAVARAVHWHYQSGHAQDSAPEPPMPAPPLIPGQEAPGTVVHAGEAEPFETEPICLRIEAEDLRQRLRDGRRRRAALATAAAAVIMFSVLSWAAHYLHDVMNYAKLAPGITLRHDPADSDSIILSYRPISAGRLAFRRIGADRETELFDEVPEEAVGRNQVLLWRTEGVREGDRFGVRYLHGWRLTTHELTVSRRDSGG